MLRNVRHLWAVLIIPTLVLNACAAGSTPASPTQSPATQPPTTMATEPVTMPTEPVTVPTEPVSEVPVASEPGSLTDIDPASVSGSLVIAGSSTVYPLTERIVERFEEEGFAGQITVDSIGSGAGFERFCKAGETDIAAASRPIKDEEIENCAAIDRNPIEFRVGTDALAVAVSSENDFLSGVSLEELAKIFSSGVMKWSDVNPAWPSEDILRFSPGTDSGTFDYFVEAVMDPAFEEEDAGRKSILDADNIQFSEDDNVLVRGVEGSPYAIGYFGYAYYEENKAALKAVPVEGVNPSEETVETGQYPLARPLFIYSDAQILKNKPQVAAFINFYLTNVNEEVLSVGYFPASDETLDAARQAWLTAVE